MLDCKLYRYDFGGSFDIIEKFLDRKIALGKVRFVGLQPTLFRIITRFLAFRSLVALGTVLWGVDRNVFADVSVQIIGGEDVSGGEFPWMGALIYSDYDDIAEDQFCGCVLVAPDWVLTAAHCVDELELDEFVVAIGDEDLANSPMILTPKTLIVNFGWSQEVTQGGDLALVQLNRPIEEIGPVGYLRMDHAEELPDSGRAIGWGLTEIGVDETYVPTSKLQFADIPIYEYLDPFVTENFVLEYLPEFIATGSLDPAKGASSGDSGGPLLILADESEEWIVAGIVSHGGTNESVEAPLSMYTDVSVYSDWVDLLVGYKNWNGVGFNSWGYDTGIFEETGENGLPLSHVWPFGYGYARSLYFSSDLKNWQEFNFRMGSFNSYRWNEDGSFSLFPEDWIGEKRSIFIKYEESSQLVSSSGPLPLYPNQITRGSSSRLANTIFGQDQTIYKFQNLVAGRRYQLSIERNEDFSFSLDFYEKIGDKYYAKAAGFMNLSGYSAPFTAGSGSEYWISISAFQEGYGYEIDLQEMD